MSNGITINEHGAVYSGLVVIGEIKGDKCLLYKRPGPQVYKAIKEAAGKELSFDIAPENAPTGAPTLPPAGVSIPAGIDDSNLNAPAGHPGPSGPVGEAGSQGPIDHIGGAVSPPPAAAKPSDPEPKQNPEKGCKDPVWIAWKARQ